MVLVIVCVDSSVLVDVKVNNTVVVATVGAASEQEHADAMTDEGNDEITWLKIGTIEDEENDELAVDKDEAEVSENGIEDEELRPLLTDEESAELIEELDDKLLLLLPLPLLFNEGSAGFNDALDDELGPSLVDWDRLAVDDDDADGSNQEPVCAVDDVESAAKDIGFVEDEIEVACFVVEANDFVVLMSSCAAGLTVDNRADEIASETEDLPLVSVSGHEGVSWLL